MKSFDYWNNLPEIQFSEEELLALIDEFHLTNSQETRNKIVENYVRFIRSYIDNVLGSFEHCQSFTYPEKEDMFHEGVVQCLKAVEN